MARKTTDNAAAEPVSDEAALAALETLVSAMEAGQMPLDRLLGSYPRGTERQDFCRVRLRAGEDQVKVLEDSRTADGSGE